MATPGIFPPVRVKGADAELIDGVAVRQNPLPALFDWLKLDENVDLARRLEHGTAPTIHVVYNVPIDAYNPKPGEGESPIDIVEAAFASMELARRRDTRQEVRQTNETAGLARCLDRPGPLLKISAQEIAPERDLAFHNPWDPKPREVLAAAAGGCRAAMERLYEREIAKYGGDTGKIGCSQLLGILTPERAPFISIDAPGLREICAECTRMLTYSSRPEPEQLSLL